MDRLLTRHPLVEDVLAVLCGVVGPVVVSVSICACLVWSGGGGRCPMVSVHVVEWWLALAAAGGSGARWLLSPGASAATTTRGWYSLYTSMAGCGGLWLRMASLLLHECCQHGGLVAQVWVWAVAVGWWGARCGVCHGSAVLLSSLRALRVADTHHGTTYPLFAAASHRLPWLQLQPALL